ncbi:hypothetical protein C7974DRAFT_401027 [Boeremia exigua]|uniref:uncharacterized protein n=1 Tax=Boeremia exigua TaxID=749465 RepID=UPI001E8D0844|nr:uncharacterized protein C7974DRAFT_401027 [Boeremia exigua]KAH6618861.1 hypothetical protein C7974DRAFT_401027 [Boeremia exigua]
MAFGGAALKFIATALYALEFGCAAVILGIYSYFLSVQADRNVTIPRWQQAVEGISGAAVLYTILAIVFTCCLGGKTFFALLGLILNALFCGGMIAIAVLTRDGASSCTGYVETPLGNGASSSKEGFGSTDQGNQITYAASLGTTCRLNTACFAVAIIGAFLFLLSIPVQLFLGRHHKKEKRFGPGPTNNYTGGSGRKFWQRKQRNNALRDPEVAAVPVTNNGHAALAPGARDYRPSHDTHMTGSTVAAPHGTATTGPLDNHGYNKPVSGGFHTAPHATPATNY